MGAYKAVYIKIFRAGEGCKAVDSDLSVDKASMRILCLKLSLRNTHTLRVPGFDARARLERRSALLSNLTFEPYFKVPYGRGRRRGRTPHIRAP